MTRWLLLLAAVASEVTASLSLKAALDRPAFYVVVAVGYLASFALLAVVLRLGMPLGVAYGIWGALGVAATAAFSALLFDEPLTAVMALGMAIVVAGVLLVELGSQAAGHERPAPVAAGTE
ncbi:QacE family quaternary ammonium compound efflux SMR transporter [Nocardioides guangzhouensis]|uniref:QacE family quaternary ammonium compound efflux SMR transporter n=1 Tax=Nocardioides guangzhouensis TaxID=2497878 RepID=A0A4Q4Z1E6_9ACTN|nr:SMR family transporter [Nocardioides guangzhouensis]RYP80955.1 QacE family quaternary ammonium compound efflux SMR transporter [Nocardioides guangzhouensis]